MCGSPSRDPSSRNRIDREERARLLDLSLAIQSAAVRMEDLKRQWAEAQLAVLMDPERIAAMEAARDNAQQALSEAEAAMEAARKAFAIANRPLKDGRERDVDDGQ